MPARGIAALLLALTLAAPARAQESGDVVLLAPPEVRAEWTAAVQVELAPRGASVIPADPPTAPTVLLRDATAQQVAIDRGAAAAAWVEATDRGWDLRVVDATARAPRVTPVAADADARTFALILVSLLDEPAAPAPTPVTVLPSMAAVADPPAAVVGDASPGIAQERLADPATPWYRTSTGAVDAEVPPEDAPEAAAPTGDRLAWSGQIGSAGFLIVNDRQQQPGIALRGGVGLHYGYFEGAVLADVALFLDRLPGNGDEIQPLARACLEGGAMLPVDSTGLHVGLRACGGFAEMRRPEFDPFGGFSFPVDNLGGLFSAGGYLAVSFALTDSLRWGIRADIEASFIDPSPHWAAALPMLTSLLTFR